MIELLLSARKTYLFIRTRVIALQALARRRTAQHVVAQLRLDRVIAKSQPHRTRVFMEMYATEASYVQQLSFAVNVFLKPLRALVEKAGVTSAQIVCMFGMVVVRERRILRRIS